MKFLQVGSIFTQISDRCVMMLTWEEGTTVAGGVTWSLGVAVELMETTQVRSTWRFDALTNSRWWTIFAKVEFVVFCVKYCVRVGLVLDLELY